MEFKICANREKNNFACFWVKYLGHWTEKSGSEVDADKTATFQKMPSPRIINQVQSSCNFNHCTNGSFSFSRILLILWIIWPKGMLTGRLKRKKKLFPKHWSSYWQIHLYWNRMTPQSHSSCELSTQWSCLWGGTSSKIQKGRTPDQICKLFVEYYWKKIFHKRTLSTCSRLGLKFRGYIERLEVTFASDH